MVSLVGAGNLRKATRSSPVKAPAVNDDASHRRTMSANPFGGAVHDDIGAPIEWIAQIAAGAEGIVDYQRHIVAMSDSGKTLKVGYIARRITHRFGIHGTCFSSMRASKASGSTDAAIRTSTPKRRSVWR